MEETRYLMNYLRTLVIEDTGFSEETHFEGNGSFLIIGKKHKNEKEELLIINKYMITAYKRLDKA